MPPLVSVIVPVYNGERYIVEALASLQAQTYITMQVIVVNDGSTDRSESLILGSSLDLEYVSQPNGGIASAYNRGIAQACGDFISFLEHDDVWLPEKLEREIGLLLTRPALGMVYSRYYIADSNGDYEQSNASTLELLDDCFEQLLGQTLSGSTILPFSSATIRSALLRQIGPLDSSLAISVDYDTWLKIAYFSQIGFIAEPSLLYRQHGSNASRNGLRAVEDDLKILERWAAKPDVLRKMGRRSMCARLARCHLDLAWMHQQAGDAAAARNSLARAARVHPGSLGAWSRLAWSYLPPATARRLEWYARKLRLHRVPAASTPGQPSID